MKKLILILSIFSASKEVGAQSKSVGDHMLDLIIKDGEPFEYIVPADDRQTSEDSLGVKTLYVNKRTSLENKYYRNLLIVDTFGLFSLNYKNNLCKGGIKVVSKLPKNIQATDSRVFWLNGIGTGKENALALSIMNLRTNRQSVYYFSILGKDVKIVKTAHGIF